MPSPENKSVSWAISKDGTRIAYDRTGRGPTIILVSGALGTRFSWSDLPKLLSSNFVVVAYDRRGRGNSTNTFPYSLDREIEDIEALVDQTAGGASYLYGISSGGALALEAALRLGKTKVRKLAMYEVPYSTDEDASMRATIYHEDLTRVLASGNKGEAIVLFMKQAGLPDQMIQSMRHAPMWRELEAVAPTLLYDSEVLGRGFRLNKERVAQVSVPSLVMIGGSSPPYMKMAAQQLMSAIHGAKLRTLEGQTHDVLADVIAPILKEFFAQ